MDPSDWESLGTVAIITPHPANVAFAWHRSMSQMVAWQTSTGIAPVTTQIDVTSGTNINKARNELVQQFLETDCDWALLCDADMAFNPDAVVRLLVAADKTGTKIIGGLYCIVSYDGLIPTLFIDDPETVTKVHHDYPDDAVVAVAATGTGFLLVHRDVFTTFQETFDGSPWCWFVESQQTGTDGIERWIGEDITFCLQARALGFSVFVDCTTHIGHSKGNRVWWPKDIREGHRLKVPEEVE